MTLRAEEPSKCFVFNSFELHDGQLPATLIRR